MLSFAILVATSLIGVGNAQTFYDGVIGPLTITKDGRATLLVPVDNREMSLRIVYPDQGGRIRSSFFRTEHFPRVTNMTWLLIFGQNVVM